MDLYFRDYHIHLYPLGATGLLVTMLVVLGAVLAVVRRFVRRRRRRP
jgi:hypothetical protein